MLNTFTIVKITRSNRVAGYFSYRKQCIALHAELFVNGRQAHLVGTFLHEVAHLIQGAFYATTKNPYYAKPHGRGWQYIMRLLGEKPEVTHAYPYLIEKIKNAQQAREYKYEYVCKDCGHTFKKNRILKNEGFRYHGPCRHKPNQGQLSRIDLIAKAA